MECRIDNEGELIYFECERCNQRCVGVRADIDIFGRIFCGNCGACYTVDFVSETTGLQLYARRIWFSQMYLPPLECLKIFGDGQLSGQRAETFRRQNYRTFWQRLADFIRNR